MEDLSNAELYEIRELICEEMARTGSNLNEHLSSALRKLSSNFITKKD